MLVVAALSLVGCGGGSSSKPDTNTNNDNTVQNIAPIVSLTNQTVIEKSEVTISASASDTDGTIQSYQWQQTSGINVELSNTTSNHLTFSAPSIVENTELTFKVTVTDDDGAQTSESMTLTVEPNIIASFTLSGQVTTGKTIANANITAQLGDLQFTTQSNEVGSYQLNINVDDDYQEQLLTLSATGPSTNSVIKLVSELGNIDDVVELAESHENRLSANEHIGLKLSHFSTVVAALMVQQNNDQAVVSVEQYQTALNNLNIDILKTYAAMMKYLIDNISDLPAELMPENFENTYQLFSNKQAITQLFYAFNNYQSTLLGNLESELLADKETIGKRVSLEMGSPYYLAIGKLVLNENGTGTLITSLTKEQNSISWAENNKGLKLQFEEPLFYKVAYIYPKYSYEQVQANGYIKSYNINNVYQGNKLSILLISHEIEYKDIVTNDVIETEYPETDAFFNVASQNKKLTNDVLTPIKASKDFIISMSLPNNPVHYNLPDNNSAVPIEMTAAKVRFNAESSKTATIESVIDKDFNTAVHNAEWSINNDGELELMAEKLNVKIAKLQDKSDVQANVMTFTHDLSEPNKVSPEIGKIYEIDTSLTWTNENVPGIYIYENKSQDLNTTYASWYELREDGTLSYFSTYSWDTPLGYIDESDIYESVGLWRIINNQLIIRRYRGNGTITGTSNHCHSEVWETNVDSECIMFIERKWTSVQLTTHPEEKHVILQNALYFDDHWRSYIDPENKVPNDEHLYRYISQLVTEFTRSNERPVQLPESYIPIKDRTNSKATPVKTNASLFNEKLELGLN
ncbi:carboxypeptidase-like regulatory domain-containing protein [Pseudoalteromonas sp. G4]|uniref:carboxypeptidase-like regulatory domain-containing protein n=1 Tax=Pseudoalteromonas sp. G4 TaxID=2992761 RepID=UPI00237DE6A3|nr:hypothetical protein [Pseudoalteromonas sp. G4]MDE3272106.1 hypothetical protein [Pseudoalteromonas sp. G4]